MPIVLASSIRSGSCELAQGSVLLSELLARAISRELPPASAALDCCGCGARRTRTEPSRIEVILLPLAGQRNTLSRQPASLAFWPACGRHVTSAGWLESVLLGSLAQLSVFSVAEAHRSRGKYVYGILAAGSLSGTSHSLAGMPGIWPQPTACRGQATW